MNLNVLAVKPFRLVLPSLLNSNEMSFRKFPAPTGLRIICNSKKKQFTLLFVMISIGVLMLFTYRKGRGTQEIIARQANTLAQKDLETVGNSSKAEKNTTVGRPLESIPKLFLYLTQTEQCLSHNLSFQIGDEKSCKCDVIVFSFRTECREAKPSHISYIFDKESKESTWTSGRNKLYFLAKQKKPGYHYYIFMDDDVYLKFNAFAPQEIKKLTPFRAFEKWLLDNEPAVGVCDYFGAQRNQATFIWQRRHQICGITDNYKKSTTLPVVFFDALLNAIHHKAMDHLLPFPTHHDKESWWTPQIHVICSAELKFRGQALLFAPVTVYNLKHRWYPRRPHNFNERANEFVKEIQKRAPAAYQNRPLFKQLRNGKLEQYALKSITYCMNPAHRHKIVPYLHFEREGLEL